MRKYSKILLIMLGSLLLFVGCSQQESRGNTQPVSSALKDSEKYSTKDNTLPQETVEQTGEETLPLVMKGEEETSGTSLEKSTAENSQEDLLESSKETLGTREETSEAASASFYAMPTLSQITEYDWLDVSIVIMNTILTKIDNHVGEPSFALFHWNETEEPVLFTGYRQEDGQAEYTIYTFNGNTIMEIGQCTGLVKINRSTKEIAFNGLGGWEVYQYQNYQMVREGGYEQLSGGFEDIKVDSLRSNIVTAENIGEFIQN